LSAADGRSRLCHPSLARLRCPASRQSSGSWSRQNRSLRHRCRRTRSRNGTSP
jgi:hypothetical protein